MTVISGVDLFCGLGGLTHGLITGGVNVVAGFDLDEACRFPYETNNRARFVAKDVQLLKGSEIQALWQDQAYTLLAGCAPCQPFSTYSQKAQRLEDGSGQGELSRWQLVRAFGRLVKEARPDLVTMENVPQLRMHRIFPEFLAALKGYKVWHKVVECSEYGVPQTRKRFVLLASRLGPISLLPPTDQQGRRTVRQTISHLPALLAGESDPVDPIHSACRLSELNLRRIRASRPGGTWRDWPPALVAACHRKQTGGTYPSVYGRMEWDAPAPTITTQCYGYGSGRFGHPEQDRAITLREAALLQTFPDTYQFLREGEPVAFSILGRLIGNAVPVLLGQIVADSLLRHVDGVQSRRRRA